ncbi:MULTISPECIES: DNA gyrase subunit A [unclassified Terrabacter]|uniref:DNA gyrase subunit A n=1 Tax=unclassified Terrabacter TaxID=2630222 RepID=UPI0006FDB4C7|nr:DNA gyrase subunit A [Terrabacter sp. Root181]KRF38224.1 DNA gyrase subunit A [Terrabacter sp. Soil810]
MSDDLPPNDGDDVNETPGNETPGNETPGDETPDQSIEDILGPDPEADTDADDEGDPNASAVVVPSDIGQHDRVEPIDLNTEMQRSYIEYAMSVIVSRALPDVRDGLKPVHRRIVYAMYDGGYRPDRGYNKCARVVGDVMGHYHPHGDSAIYDALVRLVQDWSLRYPLVDGQGNFGSRGNDGAAAPRYTECRMASIAMEMVRDIEQDTVDFVPNYDGKTMQPAVLPSRFPNLLVNGSAGIAVGMATQIPAHNLREVAAGAQYYLDHPEISREDLLEALLGIIKGPDFPTGALIMGHKGIEEAYRTGRGSIIMRAVVEVEEIQNRQCLVVTELPYQVNPDMLALKIADLVKDGKISGIADIRDETSGRTGQRLVIVLKRDAVAKVVLNNLYKHTQLQTTFGANMLALVDEVPRTLPLDGFIRHWVDHQVEVIVRRTTFRLRKAEADIHILRGLLKALDRLDEVIALIRGSRTVDIARDGLIELLEIDEIQANAILNMQLRRLAALEREKLIEAHDELQTLIDEYTAILASPVRQREIISEELADIVERYGDERRTTIVPFDGDMSMEDLIPEEDVVVTITRGGYAKRTRVDQYRSQKRGGKGVRGASLRGEDVVEHFFTTTTHHWLLFFTNLGRVYRAKAYELPEGSRDSKGQHVANLLAFQPGEQIAQVLAIRDYAKADYLVLATRAGLVKKTRLADYDSNRSGGLIAINLREGDELVGAGLASNRDDLLLVSRKGQSVRFTATDEALRPMGRSTSGVTGMKFRHGDDLLAMSVVEEGESPDVFVVFENGLAKRTPVSEYRLQGRGGLGIKVAKLSEKGGDLVGALTVIATDEVMVVMEKGKIVRSRVDEVRHTGRSSQGVKFATPDKGDSIVAVARNAESAIVVGEIVDGDGAEGAGGGESAGDAASAPGAPATVPGPDGVPSDETSGDEASSSDTDNGGDE